MGLGAYIGQRLLLLVPVIWGVTLLTFTFSHLVPGDPAALAAGPQATREMVEQLRREFGLDQPLPVQYWNYLSGLARGDWGMSMLSRRPVAEDLRIFWPATLELVLAAMTLAVLLGVPLGVVAAVHADRWPDQAARLASLLGVSVPAFFLAVLLQLLLGLKLGWLAIGGRLDTGVPAPPALTGLYLVDSLAAGQWATFGNALGHIVLPAFTLSVAPLATITRMMRASLLEVLGQDYVRLARAKGLAERQVLFVHALRNAAIPTITMIGLSFGWLMGGSVLVESVYDWPGIGLYAVRSTLALDFMPIMGITLLYGIVFSLINLAVDCIYGVVDPRIRHG